MASSPPVGGLQLVNTTIFITNLHCPSCVNSIKDALQRLDPPPIAISHSIISHSVTIRHETSLSTESITTALELAGFEVHSIFQDLGTTQVASPIHRGAEWENSLEQSVRRWRQTWRESWRHSRNPDMQQREKHLSCCEECAAEKDLTIFERRGSFDDKEIESGPVPPVGKEYDIEKLSTVSGSPSILDVPLDSIIATSPLAPKLYQASIAITGMTCSACVGSITGQVEELPYVRSVSVSLLTHSASVEFEGEDNIGKIIETIEDAGFDASLDHLEEISSLKRPESQPKSDKWRVVYAVGGMTCSACTGAVTDALKKYDWVESVDVALISNSVTVVFTGKEHVEELKEVIEDVGYDATLDSIELVQQELQENIERSITIRVDGMFCHHCPSNVVEMLEREYEGEVKIENSPTLEDPLLQIKYTPAVPDLTIRLIIASIAAVHPALKPSIFHPPTLEERAKEMHARERRRILFRLGLSVIVAIPTFIIGIVYMSLVSSDNPGRMFLMQDLWTPHVSRAQWALFILATPVYFFGADAFHRRAIKEVRALWRPGSTTPILQRFYRFGSMNMLMCLGTSIAYLASVGELGLSASGIDSVGNTDYYFDSVVFLTMFILIGRFLEAYSKTKTGDAVTALGNLRPTEAILIDPIQRQDQKTNVDLLEIGDIVRVQHGASPPFDGTVLDAAAQFDESSLTGESRPVQKDVGDTVYAGTVNKGGPIQVRLSTISGTSMLDQIIKVVREGQTRRAPVERVADMITSHFVPCVTLVAVTTWIVWLALGLSGKLPEDYRGGDSGNWPLWSLRFAIAVFVVACPCGIGLASPTALFVGGGLAARHGILVKGGGEAFQEASALDAIVFDKTGTLTQGGDPAVTDVEVLAEGHPEKIYELALRLEEGSGHLIATAITSYCTPRVTQQDFRVVNAEEIAGKGMNTEVKSTSSNRSFKAIIGNESLMTDHTVALDDDISTKLGVWKSQGKSVALMAICTSDLEADIERWTLSAAFAISDPLRPEALATVTALQARGIDVWMLSGDNPVTANAVGVQVGIPPTNIIAGVLPDQKAEKIQYLQKSLEPKGRGKKHATVAMVGDGINDSPALTMADVGVAIGSGSDVAISSADFILVTSHLEAVLTLVDLSRIVFRRVWFNFGWALVYNLAAMPIAAGVLYPVTSSSGQHVRLDPVWASLAMALSSVSVVCSSLLLKSKIPWVGFRGRVANEA